MFACLSGNVPLSVQELNVFLKQVVCQTGVVGSRRITRRGKNNSLSKQTFYQNNHYGTNSSKPNARIALFKFVASGILGNTWQKGVCGEQCPVSTPNQCPQPHQTPPSCMPTTRFIRRCPVKMQKCLCPRIMGKVCWEGLRNCKLNVCLPRRENAQK